MSTTPQNPQLVIQDGKMLFQCPACSNPMAMKVPIAEIGNTPRLSIISLTHEKGTSCRKCGRTYVPILANANPIFGLMEIEPEGIIEQVSSPVASLG